MEQKLQGGVERFDTQSFSRSRSYADDFNSNLFVTPRPRGYSRVSGGTNIKRRDSIGSAVSGNSTSVIMKVMGNRSIASQSNRSFVSTSSMGNQSMKSTILGNRKRRQGVGLGGNRGNMSYNGSVRSGRSGRSRRSGRSGNVQIIDGDSMIDDDDLSQMSSSIINVFDEKDQLTKEIFHNNKAINSIQEIDEDKDEEDSDLPEGSFMSGDNIIVNFEVIYDKVRQFEADFIDKNDYVLNYKNNISYINNVTNDVTILEAYLILTKKNLYVFDLSQEEYPMLFQTPIKTEEIYAFQMSLTNTLAGVFKIKNRQDVKFVVFEDDTLEQFVIYVKAAFGTKIAVEYNDMLFSKNEKGVDIAFNLIDMRYFDPKDLKQRFNKP